MKHAERRKEGTNKNRTTARSSSRQRRRRCGLFPGDASSSVLWSTTVPTWIPISMYCWMASTALRVLWGGETYAVVGLQPPRRFASVRASETVLLSTNGRAIDADDTTENAKTTTAASSSSATPPPLILPSHPNFPIRSVMAPMVAASDYPFRVLVREYGQVDLTYTQMILAKRFNVDKSFRRTHLDLYETTMTTTTSNTSNSNTNHNRNDDDENDQTYWDHFHPAQLNCIGRTEHDRTAYHDRRTLLQATGTPLVREAAATAPLMVQLAGDTVDDVVHTALQIYDHTDGHVHGFDLNCGCPQHIAKKGNYGAFLLDRDPIRVRDILHGLRQALPTSVAVSAKIRLPVDDPTLLERIPLLMATGINFLTIHGRTIKENKTKVAGVHTDRIKLAIETAHAIDPTFPIVVNGGMEHYDDVQHMMSRTGASAAMSSEALLENPEVFLQPGRSSVVSPETRFRKQIAFARNYVDVCYRVGPPLPGVMGPSGSYSTIRIHLFKFLYRYLIYDHHDLRDKLAANKSAIAMTTLGEVQNFVTELESRYAHMSPDEWKNLASSSSVASWYRRHRKQPDRFIHARNNGSPSSSNASNSSNKCTGRNNTIDDRKREIRERLAKMAAQKESRNQFV